MRRQPSYQGGAGHNIKSFFSAISLCIISVAILILVMWLALPTIKNALGQELFIMVITAIVCLLLVGGTSLINYYSNRATMETIGNQVDPSAIKRMLDIQYEQEKTTGVHARTQQASVKHAQRVYSDYTNGGYPQQPNQVVQHVSHNEIPDGWDAPGQSNGRRQKNIVRS